MNEPSTITLWVGAVARQRNVTRVRLLERMVAGAFGDDRQGPLASTRSAEISKGRPVRSKTRGEHQDAALINGTCDVVASVEGDGVVVCCACRDRTGHRLADFQDV